MDVSLPIMISPSVLPCDFSKLGAEVEALDAAGVDLDDLDTAGRVHDEGATLGQAGFIWPGLLLAAMANQKMVEAATNLSQIHP